ncbi:MAG: SMC-Scp complex subunit ScpB [Bacteroidota bacterium]
MQEQTMQVAEIVEALIFAAEAPLRKEAIVELFQHEDFAELEFNDEILEAALQAIQEKLRGEAFVFELRQIDGGYQMYTKAKYYPYVRHAAVVKNQKRLSRAALETLSIIAYKQPITKTEIEFIRGVNCDYTVRSLLDKNLVDIRGRADAPGRPLLYGTSSYFMEYFGINAISELPKLTEIKADAQEFQASFRMPGMPKDQATVPGKKTEEEE